MMKEYGFILVTIEVLQEGSNRYLVALLDLLCYLLLSGWCLLIRGCFVLTPDCWRLITDCSLLNPGFWLVASAAAPLASGGALGFWFPIRPSGFRQLISNLRLVVSAAALWLPVYAC
jgi:hypothetical protein